MRVCLVSREFAPFWGGGIGAYAAQMAVAWAAAGHTSHVVTLPHPGLAEDSPRLFPNVHFHTLDVPPASPAVPLAFQRHAAAVRDTLDRLHAAHPFDYIEFPDYWAEGHLALTAARTTHALAGATLSIRLHTPTHEARRFNAEPPGDAEIALLELAEDLAIRSADLLVSPTRSLLDLVTARLGPCGRLRAVIPYPFDPASLAEFGAPSPDAPAATLAPTVLYFGRLERRKGVEVLVAAALRLLDQGTPASFTLIGGDTNTGPNGSSMRRYLESIIPERHRSRVRITGPRPRASLGPEIRAAAASGGLCCFPSLWENFPNTCVEAMALGAPVVGSDAGGMAEIIEDGRSGVLFSSGDPESLAEAIRRILADPALRQRIAAAAPDRIADLCDPAGIVARTSWAVQMLGRAAPAGCAP